jgi:hypothetical protein
MPQKSADPLLKLWHALERVEGLAAVTAEWRHYLGAEWDRFRDMFRASTGRAQSYPRWGHGGDCERLAVVHHGRPRDEDEEDQEKGARGRYDVIDEDNDLNEEE